jgi:ketosteroid isomerase-like protein
MLKYGVGALVILMLAGTAQAAGLSPVDIINRHTAAGAKSDLDAIMADYADDAVVLQAGKAFQGKAAIRPLFARMFPKRPAAGTAPTATASSGKARPSMKVTRVWQEGNVGFMTWEMGPIHATEEFLVRNNKIAVQAVFMSGAPQTPAK